MAIPLACEDEARRIAALAILMAGHVRVPLCPNLTADVVRHVLEHSRAWLLFVGKLDPAWEEMRRGVPVDLPSLTFPLLPALEAPGWGGVVSAQAPLREPVVRSRDEVATVIYTFGTTGQPKGATMSFGAMSAVACRYASLLEAGPGVGY
jgi:long-chain acyl-CoA synthetase